MGILKNKRNSSVYFLKHKVGNRHSSIIQRANKAKGHLSLLRDLFHFSINFRKKKNLKRDQYDPALGLFYIYIIT